MADKSPLIDHLTDRSRFGTQTRLAQAAGVKPHTISGKANGDNPLTYAQMRRILRAAPEMGVELDAWDFFPEEASAQVANSAGGERCEVGGAELNHGGIKPAGAAAVIRKHQGEFQ